MQLTSVSYWLSVVHGNVQTGGHPRQVALQEWCRPPSVVLCGPLHCSTMGTSVAVLTQLTQPKCRWAKSCIIYRGLLGVSSVEQCAAASLSNGPHGGGCWITDGNVLWPNSGVLRQMDHHPRHAAVLSLFLKRLLARLNTLICSAWSSCRVSTPFVSRTLSPKGILWILRYVGFKSIS